MASGDIERTVVVTGGSRGIGRAVCEAFAAPGTLVCFNYAANRDAAAETERAIAAAGAESLSFQADVSNEAEVSAFFKAILERSGRIDVLVNNAGITRDGLLARMKTEDWDRVIAINLNGAFHCTKQVTKPMMKQRQGRIINITSVIGVMGNPGQCNYAASKAAIIGFTKSVARELASRNITANAVAPGYIDTEMTQALPEKAREALVGQIPLGRIGTCREVAETVLFLASPTAAYITGQVIHVNGGLYT